MKRKANKNNMKICLVGSSGGHLTHLYMLKPFWKDKDRFCLTQNGEWLNVTLKDFFSSKLCQSNRLYSEQEKKKWILAQKSNLISKSII